MDGPWPGEERTEVELMLLPVVLHDVEGSYTNRILRIYVKIAMTNNRTASN